MSETSAPAQEEIDVVKYDITVELEKGVTLEQFRQTAIDVVGIQEARVDALVKVLRSGPSARIGAEIPQDRAFKARDDFTKAGLKVTLSAVLALQKKTVTASDGKEPCPACDARVLLPANRQCPNCGVFVDKVTPEMLLRKKLLEQEKRKMEMRQDNEQKNDLKKQQEAMERRVRDDIRAELEEEYGLTEGGSRMSKATKMKLAGAALGLVAVAFLGGRFLGGGAGSAESLAKGPGASGASGSSAVTSAANAAAGASKGADIDKILQTLPSAGDVGIVAPESGDETEQEMAMLKSARNGGPNAQGMSMEQAVAASMTLAQSVGNTSAQRALSGTGAAGGGAGQAAGSTAGVAGAGAGVAGGVVEATQITGLPVEFKKDAAVVYAVALAEMGQSVRGRGILKELQNSPTIAPALADKLRAAEIQVSAWGLARTSADRAKKLMAGFGAELAAIKDPALRANAASQVAVALASQSNAPELAAQPMLTLAADAVSQVSGPQQALATEHLMIATGKVLLAGIESASRAGQLNKANDLAGKLDSLSKQAKNNAASASLLALLYRAKQLTSTEAASSAVLDAAMASAAKVPELPSRISAIQTVGELAGAGAAITVQKNLQALDSALQLEKGGARLQAASAMSTAYASLGDSVKAAVARRLLGPTAEVAPAEIHTLAAITLVNSDIALARHMLNSGFIGQADAVLIRIAGYLFT